MAGNSSRRHANNSSRHISYACHPPPARDMSLPISSPKFCVSGPALCAMRIQVRQRARVKPAEVHAHKRRATREGITHRPHASQVPKPRHVCQVAARIEQVVQVQVTVGRHGGIEDHARELPAIGAVPRGETRRVIVALRANLTGGNNIMLIPRVRRVRGLKFRRAIVVEVGPAPTPQL